jgi:chromosome segregation ATPase
MNSEDFNKLQHEAKETIKIELYEIKKTTQDMKQEFNKDMENLRKKEPNRNAGNKKLLNKINTGESHSNRLEQVENRISGLENKIDIKEKKPNKHLDKRLKNCERNMQELSDSIKRPNQRIISIK